jgi:hypothetical protein
MSIQMDSGSRCISERAPSRCGLPINRNIERSIEISAEYLESGCQLDWTVTARVVLSADCVAGGALNVALR